MAHRMQRVLKLALLIGRRSDTRIETLHLQLQALNWRGSPVDVLFMTSLANPPNSTVDDTENPLSGICVELRLMGCGARRSTGVLLTTEVMIVEAPKDEDHSHGAAPGGMGMDM